MYRTPSKLKLIADLHQGRNIAVHLVLLGWMLANSFKVTKIHRVLQFDQKPYLKTFIDIFISKQFEAKTKVEKEIFKLI